MPKKVCATILPVCTPSHRLHEGSVAEYPSSGATGHRCALVLLRAELIKIPMLHIPQISAPAERRHLGRVMGGGAVQANGGRRRECTSAGSQVNKLQLPTESYAGIKRHTGTTD